MEAYELKSIAIDYAQTLGLCDCNVQSMTRIDDMTEHVVVAGYLPNNAPSDIDEANAQAIRDFLSDPLSVRIEMRGGKVEKHEWINIQFS